jgi:hypothetical protein
MRGIRACGSCGPMSARTAQNTLPRRTFRPETMVCGEKRPSATVSRLGDGCMARGVAARCWVAGAPWHAFGVHGFFNAFVRWTFLPAPLRSFHTIMVRRATIDPRRATMLWRPQR